MRFSWFSGSVSVLRCRDFGLPAQSLSVIRLRSSGHPAFLSWEVPDFRSQGFLPMGVPASGILASGLPGRWFPASGSHFGAVPSGYGEFGDSGFEA